MKRFALAIAALFTFVPLSTAQIPCNLGDDGFNLGCCEEPHPNLPHFPEIEVEGAYACVRGCTLENAFKMKVRLSRPEFFSCDQARFEFRASPLTIGGPTIEGRLIAKYSRTWVSTFDGSTQVWRFLLNGDWEYGPVIGTFGCPSPPHQNPSHVVGSIDYACDSDVSNATRIALNLSHLPGCLSHGPLSARPLSGSAAHYERSYHLVAPGNFTFLAGGDVEGDLRDEAVRSSRIGSCFPETYKCLNESPVEDGGLATVFKNCVCSSSTVSAWVHQEMRGEVVCNGVSSTFQSAEGIEHPVPTGLTAMVLGAYNGPSWPGDLEVNVYYGHIRYADVCGPVADAAPHRVHGVATSGVPGYLFSGPVIQPFKQFLDLQDHLLPSITPTECVPLGRGFGAPAYSSLVWNLNPR